MAKWNKVKFFYDTMLGAQGSTLSATSTAAGYDVANIYNMLETNMWKAGGTADPQYVTFDAGAGAASGADYVAILGHNLASIGASVVLQHSTDGFVSDVVDAFTPDAPATDRAYLKEFTPGAQYRHWRLKITGHTQAPYMAVCIWGNATELDYATASFDPGSQEAKAKVNLSHGGYVAGVHTRYVERSMALRFEDADAALYSKIRSWWETTGLKSFFVAWENANSPDDVFLMRSDARFDNPLKNGGLYRDVTINLKGRKE
ncbi:MAG: hypothetical protein ACE5GY_07745 [Thermodesulfobacteriota bacterium]